MDKNLKNVRVDGTRGSWSTVWYGFSGFEDDNTETDIHIDTFEGTGQADKWATLVLSPKQAISLAAKLLAAVQHVEK